MNFADMLSFADIHQLTRIASHYHCECNENSKNELIQSILTTVSRREIFEQQIDELRIEDLRFLNTLLFDTRNAFSLEELIGHIQQTKFGNAEVMGAMNPRDTIAKFKQLGWLFNGFSQQTRYLFQVPLDLKDRFRTVLERQFRAELVFRDEPPMYRDERMLLSEDLGLFLRYIQQHEVALNVDGTMYRRQQQQLVELMSVQEPLVAKGGWRFGYGRRFKDYPNRISFLYDYAYYHGWIEEAEERLLLTELGQTIVLQGQQERLTELYRFWLRLYKGAIPNLLSLVHWIEACARQWVTVASLQAAIGPFIRPYYYDQAENILSERILRMMMHLGMLRMGEGEDACQMVQMTTLGKALVHGVYISHDDKIDLPAT